MQAQLSSLPLKDSAERLPEGKRIHLHEPSPAAFLSGCIG
jgi:hypothetical protein